MWFLFIDAEEILEEINICGAGGTYEVPDFQIS
jgi:hypothetical protein